MNAYLGNQLIASFEAYQTTPEWTYYSSDHLGSPRLITGSGGNTIATPRYAPYGESLSASGVNPTQFASMERDSATGYDYDHARFTGSGLGRFLRPDRFGGRVNDPQTWNRYAYSRNNPVVILDPDGKSGLFSDLYSRLSAAGAHFSAALEDFKDSRILRGSFKAFGVEIGAKSGIFHAKLQADASVEIESDKITAKLRGEASIGAKGTKADFGRYAEASVVLVNPSGYLPDGAKPKTDSGSTSGPFDASTSGEVTVSYGEGVASVEAGLDMIKVGAGVNEFVEGASALVGAVLNINQDLQNALPDHTPQAPCNTPETAPCR